MSCKAVLFGSLTAVAITAIFTATKPRIAYDDNGNPLCFGLDEDQTIIPTWLGAVVGGAFVYALYIM